MVKVPSKTFVNLIEPQFAKYAISFAPELIPIILSGEKVKTYRYGNKYDYLKVGDLVQIENTKTKEIVAQAVVLNKQPTTFGELPLTLQGHEEYESKEQQRNVMSGYYAYLGKALENSDQFLILEFQLKP